MQMQMQIQNPMIQKQKYINPKDIQIDDFDGDLDDDTESEPLDNSENKIVSIVKPISKPKKSEIKKNELINSKKRKIIPEDNIFENSEEINDKPINEELVIDKKQNIENDKHKNDNYENNLANLFDNVLDNRNINKKQKKNKDF